MKRVKKILVSGISLIAISTIGVASVNAQSFLSDKLWNKYPDQIPQMVKEQIEQKIRQPIRQRIQNWNPSDFANHYLPKNLNQDLQAAIDELNRLGELNLPDPETIRKSISDILLADVYNSKALLNYVERLTNQLERNMTRVLTDNTLGEEGQKRIKQELETTLVKAETAYGFGESAQGDVVTQDVMKKIAKQNNEIAAILASVRNDGLQLQQSQDLTNLNLTNISRAIDGQNQAKATEIVSQGFANYRTAAKATLSFSHENKSTKNKNKQQK